MTPGYILLGAREKQLNELSDVLFGKADDSSVDVSKGENRNHELRYYNPEGGCISPGWSETLSSSRACEGKSKGSLPGAKAVYFLPGNPIDALEAFPAKIKKYNLTLAKIISLADAVELEKRKELRPWFDMLAHFSDVLLLTNTKEVSPAWFTALKKSLKDRPMEIIEWPPKSNLDSMIEDIIYPEPRRLSQYFDESPDKKEILIFEEDETSPESQRAEAGEDPIPAEKYFQRDAAGRRLIKIIAP